MCLVKVHEEPDVVVPYRVASRRRSHYESYSPQRSARLSREERRPPSAISHQQVERTRVAAKAIPQPQPVPIFVKPPSPPPHPAPASPLFVEVSPAASSFSHESDESAESAYIVRKHQHEVRRQRAAEYSPARSSVTDLAPRYETFRYISPPSDEQRYHYHHHHHHHQPSSQERSVSRDRRSHDDDSARESHRSTRIEVNTSHGPREYWR